MKKTNRPLLLAIDVGNTATNAGLFILKQGPVWPLPAYKLNISTAELKKKGAARRFFSSFLKRHRLTADDVAGVIASSVVPAIDRRLREASWDTVRRPVHFITSKAPSLIRVRYKNPREVGADRLVNARAAYALYKGPSIVIDFGTATTFDCISAQAEYLGGVIAPGPVISAQALYQKTAKLPLVILKEPATVLGRNTLESIQAGLYHGYRGLVREIVTQLIGRLGPSTKVFATGGQAHWILKGLSIVDGNVPSLTLAGLYHLWYDREASLAKTRSLKELT